MTVASTKRTVRPSARTPDNLARIAADIAALDALNDEAIRDRWRGLFEVPPPKFMRRPLIQRFVAHGLQAAAFGGLPQALLKRFQTIAETERLGGISDLPDVLAIKPGTRLIRVFDTKTHTVTVEEDGFTWNGERYTSLSAIARQISGTNWNGWAFFGIKRRSMRNKNAAKSAKLGGEPPLERHGRASSTRGEVAVHG
jgi:Protein of unknown function (DUF2924)